MYSTPKGSEVPSVPVISEIVEVSIYASLSAMFNPLHSSKNRKAPLYERRNTDNFQQTISNMQANGTTKPILFNEEVGHW